MGLTAQGIWERVLLHPTDTPWISRYVLVWIGEQGPALTVSGRPWIEQEPVLRLRVSSRLQPCWREWSHDIRCDQRNDRCTMMMALPADRWHFFFFFSFNRLMYSFSLLGEYYRDK